MRHAFVDESQRPGRYLLTAVIVPSGDLGTVTKNVRAAQPSGQHRSHMSALNDARRRQLLRAYVALDLATEIVVAQHQGGNDQPARDECLRALMASFSGLGVTVAILDTRQPARDALDRKVIARAEATGAAPSGLLYDHRGSRGETLLSLPDAFGWAWGAAGKWRKLVAPAVTVIKL